VQDHGIRIVHAFDPPAVLFAGFAASWLRDVVVLSSQRCFREAGSAWKRRLLYLADARTDGVVVNCDALRRLRTTSVPWIATPVHLCYNGLDAVRFRRLPSVIRPAWIPASALMVGAVCGLRPEKGLPVLLRAFAQVRAERPNMFLVVVGDGAERGRLERLASDLGIADACRFEPTAADVVPWLSLMDVFVLPSGANEALSNALMEAMACGCACIASSVGGNPELIKDGATGLLFTPNRVEQLAERLQRLVDDPVLRRRFSQAAVDSVAAQFTLGASATRMAEIYDQVLRPTTGAMPSPPAMGHLHHSSHHGLRRESQAQP
jgi:glycosyltransferase involved in cell wall biosynthesis